MAVVLNTFTTAGTGGSNPPVGNRQEIDNIVSRITPEDTPVYSMIGRGKTRSTSPEWETDSLRAPAANAQLEGDEYVFSAISPAVRMKNHTQNPQNRAGWSVIPRKLSTTSVTLKRQQKRRSSWALKLRKDIELAIVTNAASVDGQTRVSGGLPSWLVTNVSRGGSGVNGGYNVGTGKTVAATNAPAQRAFTKALMDTVMGQVYNSGGNVRSDGLLALYQVSLRDIHVGYQCCSIQVLGYFRWRQEYHHWYCRCLRWPVRQNQCRAQPGHVQRRRPGRQERLFHRSGTA